jgi:branched-chain amino acid transport system substrate-binding protein
MIPVRLCTSFPLEQGALPEGINNSVKLATERWTAQFRSAHLALLSPIVLDDVAGNPPRSDLNRERSVAQACVTRRDTFGYIGPLSSLVASASEPVLNRAGMVQISPSNTDPALTSPLTRAALEPATYRHLLPYVTYYRMVTTDALQGPSAAIYLKARLHATTYFLVDDESPYGTGLAGAMEAYAGMIGLRLIGQAHFDPTLNRTRASRLAAIADVIAAKHPDGVLFGGGQFPGVGPNPKWIAGGYVAKDMRANGYLGPFIGGDAIAINLFVDAAGRGAVNLFATNPNADIAAAAPSFRRAYVRRFHIPVAPYDAPSYDAANILLHAIYQAATHGSFSGALHRMHTAVLSYVAHVRWHGAIGLTSFDQNGDTRNRIVSVYGVRNRNWVYVGIAPQTPGVPSTE